MQAPQVAACNVVRKVEIRQIATFPATSRKLQIPQAKDFVRDTAGKQDERATAC